MNTLEIFGIATIFIMSISIVLLVLDWIIHTLIPKIVHSYKYKHRFGKPPLAKCYCRDCKLWNPLTGKCGDQFNSRHMADYWFCYFADPMTAEEERSKHGSS